MTAKLTAQNHARESAFMERLGISYGRRRKPEIRERFGGGNYSNFWRAVSRRFLFRKTAFRQARLLRGRKGRKLVVLRKLTKVNGKPRHVWYVAERGGNHAD